MNIDGLINIFKYHNRLYIERLVVPTFTMEEARIVEKFSRGEHLSSYEARIIEMIKVRTSIILDHKDISNIRISYKRYMNVYELLMPYTKSEVDESLNRLTDKEKKVLYKRSGGTDLSKVDLNANMTQSERTRFYVIIDIMFNIIRNPEYRKSKERPIDEIIDMDKIKELNTTCLYNTLDSLFISLLFGLNKKNKKYSVKEIARLLEMDELVALKRADRAIKKYESLSDKIDSVYGGKAI